MAPLSTTSSGIPKSSIPIIQAIPPLRALHPKLSRPIGLVPTMGMLHSGHAHLIRTAAAQSANIIVSIYANPAQLLSSEDNASYASNLDADIAMLEELDSEFAAAVSSTGSSSQGDRNGVSEIEEGRAPSGENMSRNEGKPMARIAAILIPTNEAMYPTHPPSTLARGYGSYITISPLSTRLENRPTYYRGVATVVLKLFNAVKPDKAFFGEKDAQQVAVLKRMVEDFLVDVEIVVVGTVREEDGLAKGSRNALLGTRRRVVAGVLWRALSKAESLYREEGLLRGEEILGAAETVFGEEIKKQDGVRAEGKGKGVSFQTEWLRIADPASLEEIEEVDPRIGAIISGSIILMPLKDDDGCSDENKSKQGTRKAEEEEDRGMNGGRERIRLIDYVVLRPKQELITNV
ncbi:pantothenate synthase [Agyrium rufum]|nr:pantothenate synthase [Agyrium rufum]